MSVRGYVIAAAVLVALLWWGADRAGDASGVPDPLPVATTVARVGDSRIVELEAQVERLERRVAAERTMKDAYREQLEECRSCLRDEGLMP